MKRVHLLAPMFAAAALAAACGSGKTDNRPAAELGAELFQDYTLSSSTYNRFSCATCHATTKVAPPDRVYPGNTLYDVANRPDWFLGYSLQLLDSVNFCQVYFMRGEPFTPGDPDGDALYEYLVSISPDTAPPPMGYTFIRVIQTVPRGDDVHGKVVYDRTCRICHGDKDSGAGRISDSTTILNAQLSSDYNTLFPGTDHDLVVVEKVRHGQFYGIGGNMPFFAVEDLSDADLGDLLAYLNL